MKYLFNALVAISVVATVVPAHARDGKAWGGQCVVSKGGAVASASCNSEGVHCEGNGRGGVDCSWNGIEGEYQEELSVKDSVKKMKPMIVKKPAVQKSTKN